MVLPVPLPPHGTAPAPRASAGRQRASGRQSSQRRRERPRRSRTGRRGNSRSRTTSRSRRPQLQAADTSAPPRLRVPRSIAPSVSHTRAGSVSHRMGQAKNGASASTDAAPAMTAAARQRHPPRPFTRSASAAIDNMPGMGLSRGHRRKLGAAQCSSQGLALAASTEALRGTCTLSFLTRRGSASSTSNSMPAG